MNYDDIDYDEGYSMRDIDNNWLNDNMDYETDYDFDSDIDNYNYTNNWSTYTGDKINRQTDRHNNSFLDRINKKLESLEAIERSTIVERKNDSFLDLYEKIKALNSEQERNFESHQRSSLVTDNWHDRKNSSLVSTDRLINITCGKDDGRNSLKTLETILIEKKQNSSIKIMQYKEDNKKDFDERKDYSQEVQKMIDVGKVRSSIESQENNNRKDDIIETIQKKKLDGDKEEEIIRKGIVKEMLERIERQQGNSIITNSKGGTLRKEIDIGKEIGQERNMIRKEKKDDSLVKEKTNNSLRNNDSCKKSNSFKEEIDDKLKSIERTRDYTRDDSLVELVKKIEILNSPIEKKESKNDITVLEITKLLDNEKPDKHIRNIICHKCKEYGHTKKQCDRHNKIVEQINKLEFEKDIINELMEMFNVQ